MIQRIVTVIRQLVSPPRVRFVRGKRRG
jgi:hypothetical protein